MEIIRDFFKAIQESSILQGISLLIGVVMPVGGIIWSLLNKLKLKWADYDRKIYSKEFLLKQTELFIPNHYKNPEDTQVHKTNLDSFIDSFLFEQKDQFIFLEASTGVGKTTYLVNLFLAYKKKFKWWQKLFRTRPNVLLLNYNSLCRDIYANDEHNGLLTKYRKQAKKTILLIDAIDEFQVSSKDPSGTLEFSKYYSKQFIETFEKVLHNISNFQKVVFTVRSQFLTAEIKSTLNFGRHLELLPFSEDQALAYINKKIALFPSKKAYLIFVWYKLEGVDNYVEDQNNEIKLSRLPLILSYIELIVDERDTLDKLSKQNELNMISIVELIVLNWIKREVEDDSKRQGRNYGETEKLALFEFCKELAYRIAENKSPYLSISQEEYEELLQLKKVSTLKFDDRSLLKKIEKKGLTKRKLSDIGNYYSYSFVHKMFFEFFLAEYTQQLEDTPSGSALDFSNYTFAQEILVIKRWSVIKNLAPKIETIEGKNIIDGYTHLTFEELKSWHNFFKNFVQNSSLIQSFKANGLGWIEKYDREGFKEKFGTLRNIAILNKVLGQVNLNNFWDYNTQQPYPEIYDLISYIKDFISFISLQSLPILDEIEHLKCFEEIKKVHVLILVGCGLEGKSFYYFKNSIPHLEALSLSNNQISSDVETLKVFNGVRLKILDLSRNRITGEGLQYFADSAPTLEKLYLGTNQISNDVETLKAFKGVRLNFLDLSKNQITGEGLQYFADSASTLEELYLGTNQISNDIETLQTFKGVRLKTLDLARNRITGEGLQYFADSASTLEELYLHTNQISNEIETLRVFIRVRLKILDLSRNRITGEGLQYFADSAPTLEKLYLHTNQISNDVETLKAFKGVRLNFLDLSNNRITGEGLQYFADSAPTLEELDLANNQISNDVETLNAFKGARLKVLFLQNNKITGESLQYFKNSSYSITEIKIHGNHINPDTINHIQDFCKLEYLTLDANSIPEDHPIFVKLRASGTKIEFIKKSLES